MVRAFKVGPEGRLGRAGFLHDKFLRLINWSARMEGVKDRRAGGICAGGASFEKDQAGEEEKEKEFSHE